MATYKPYKKTESGKEEVKVPSSSVSGLATVATSGSYNDLANKPTIPDISGKANLKGGNGWTGNQQFNQGGYWFATDTNRPFVVELENGDELVSVNQNGVNYDSKGLGSMPFLLNGNAGTSGQVLTSQGAGKTPIWKDAPSGGGGGDSVASVVALSGALVGGNTYTVFGAGEKGSFIGMIESEYATSAGAVDFSIGNENLSFTPTQDSFSLRVTIDVSTSGIGGGRNVYYTVISDDNSINTSGFFVHQGTSIGIDLSLGSSYYQLGTGVIIKKAV